MCPWICGVSSPTTTNFPLVQAQLALAILFAKDFQQALSSRHGIAREEKCVTGKELLKHAQRTGRVEVSHEKAS